MSYVHIFFVQDFYDLVFVQHQLPYLVDGYPLGTLLVIVQDGFGRISSPLLGLFSGYFAVRNFESRPYSDIVSKRFRSLYVPAVLWSAIYFAVRLAAAFASSLMGDGSHLRTEIHDLTFNSFFGITSWPLNGPLHYLIDLFKCVLFLPVFLYLLDRLGRKGYAVAVSALFAVFIAFDFNHYSSGFNNHNILPRADLFLFFSVGVYARHIWGGDILQTLQRFSLQRRSHIVLVAAVFLLGALHWRWLTEFDNAALVWAGVLLGMAVRIAGCLLLVSGLHYIALVARKGIVIPETLTFLYFCTHLITFFVVKNIALITVGEDLPWSFRLFLFAVLPFIALIAAFVLEKGMSFVRVTVSNGINRSPTRMAMVAMLREKFALSRIPGRDRK
jgi:Acyltransferase family